MTQDVNASDRAAYKAMYEAIELDDGAAIERITKEYPSTLKRKTHVGTWLDCAAIKNSLVAAQTLINLGLDVNHSGSMDGDRPICSAAAKGKAEMVALFLRNGSVMDTSAPVRNPLFSALHSGSEAVVRILLEAGIDASVKYGKQKGDVIAAAIMQGQPHLARVIAQHLSGGDEAKAEELLNNAARVAKNEGPLKSIHILPTLDELEND